MKKILLTISVLATQLVAMAQWAIFPGSASEISCGSATEFACIGGTAIFKYNFGTSAYVQMTGAGYNLDGLGLAADGTLLGKGNPNFNPSSNLIKFNAIPAVANAFNIFNGVINNNISVLNQNYYIGSTGGNAVNNIYQWNGSAWSVLPGSATIAAKKVVAGAGPTIYAMDWSATGNNIIVYTVGANIWTALSNSTLNAIDISVGDAVKVFAINNLGKLYYRWNGAWVLDATAPNDLIRVSAAPDGTVMLLTSAGVIYKNTCANINCGFNVVTPVNTTPIQNLTVCAGQSTTLTATGTGTLTWNGGGFTGVASTFITPTVTSTTTFSVTNTDAGCTSAPTIITVSVSVPTPQFTGASVPICFGNSATLTATGTQTISWYASPTSTTALATGTVFTTPTLTSNTSYYIATKTSGCETSRTVKTVTVTPTPASPIVNMMNSNLSICSGQGTTIWIDNYSNWFLVPTGGTSSASGSQYGTGALTSNTTFYAEFYTGNCVSLRTAVTVTVNAYPSVISQTVQNLTCNGSGNGSIALTTDNMPNAYTYSWTPNVSTTYSATNLPANGYTVQIFNAQCTTTQTYNVTQPAAFNATIAVYAMNTLTYLGGLPVGGTYQWVDCDNNNTPIAGATNPSFTPTVTGNYALNVTVGGCVKMSNCITKVVTTTGVNESTLLNAITLQPNPASTQFTLNNVLVGSTLAVIDITGKIVLTKTLNDVKETIDTTNLANGIYVIQLQNNGAVAHKKLVISK